MSDVPAFLQGSIPTRTKNDEQKFAKQFQGCSRANPPLCETSRKHPEKLMAPAFLTVFHLGGWVFWECFCPPSHCTRHSGTRTRQKSRVARTKGDGKKNVGNIPTDIVSSPPPNAGRSPEVVNKGKLVREVRGSKKKAMGVRGTLCHGIPCLGPFPASPTVTFSEEPFRDWSRQPHAEFSLMPALSFGVICQSYWVGHTGYMSMATCNATALRLSHTSFSFAVKCGAS